MAVKAKDQITLSAVVDVYAVYRYYKLQASTLAAPSKPTVSPPSGWSDTEPSYTSGSTNTLYTVDCNVFSDGTFAYSAVSKSSSYEAAKEAWNKADAAMVSSVEQFYLSTSATSLAGGSWLSTQPTWTQGKFIWRRTLVTYGSGRTEHTPSANGVCISGNTGQPGAPGADGKTLFGTCDTATGTAAKVVSGVAGFSLYSGVTVAIKFSAPNTASLPTLDINGSGAKPIMINGVNAAFWVPGSTVPFVYDGAAWQACNAPIYGSTATIGNPSGGNVYVDGDSVDIRKGSTILASISEKLIELGKNATSAVIDLCGGSGTISSWLNVGKRLLTLYGKDGVAIGTSVTGNGEGYVMQNGLYVDSDHVSIGADMGTSKNRINIDGKKVQFQDFDGTSYKDSGTIAYYAATKQLAFMAPGSIAMAACQTLPDGTVQPYDTGVACNPYGVLLKGAVEASGTMKINSKPVLDYITSRSVSGRLVTETYASGKKMISTSSPISFANGLGRVAVSNNVVSVYIASYGSMTVTGAGTTFKGVMPVVLRPQVDVVAAGTALGNTLAQLRVDTAGDIVVHNWAGHEYWAASLSYVVNP